jgi:hypothetical protein
LAALPDRKWPWLPRSTSALRRGHRGARSPTVRACNPGVDGHIGRRQLPSSSVWSSTPASASERPDANGHYLATVANRQSRRSAARSRMRYSRAVHRYEDSPLRLVASEARRSAALTEIRKHESQIWILRTLLRRIAAVVLRRRIRCNHVEVGCDDLPHTRGVRLRRSAAVMWCSCCEPASTWSARHPATLKKLIPDA